ncbi:hypothetical protein N6L24_00895 [Cognatishimia sp. SS12]|uniref:hypothetical protein n=1 Tax=Cognatishimia sp. SS12 TaxID=2979465 RepID=UPI00232B5D54|nr:hypothetical protein [Cognatishimia sp. SS12]MDC0736824.1 hypothetical protein [Cognatishimia sp. SS12]
MPNSIAFLVLASWPLIMVGLFRAMPPARALIWSFLGAYLLLPPNPTAFDFPLMPPINKLTLPNLTSLFLVIFMLRIQVKWLPESLWGKVLTLVFVFSPLFTVLTNSEPVLFATGGLRGLYFMDVIALVMTQMMLLISFTLARQFLTTKEDMRDLLIALCIAGLFYSFPMLLEVRLSPQLNVWIYGYFQHAFDQMMRNGGFRAIVFLNHGIWAAMFIMMALAATATLTKYAEGRARLLFGCATVFLFVVLVLNKTLSPLIYGLVFLALVFLTNWRMHLRLALLLASLTIAYPLIKGVQMVPETQILAAASAVHEERARSLKFRFDQETILLDRAAEKPIFGWGTWGRNQILDPVTGRIQSISDGRWIITIGVFGWVGFLAEFGLLALPIFLLAFEAGRAKKTTERLRQRHARADIPIRRKEERMVSEQAVSPMAGAMALILALNMVDLLPNATLTPLTWILSGALLGYAEALNAQVSELGERARSMRRTALSGTQMLARNAPELPKPHRRKI